MSDEEKKPRSKADEELEQEIRRNRKFTLEEAIGRMAGPGAMKGESPVSRLQQAEFQIGTWLRSQLGGNELEVVLHRSVRQCELLLNQTDQPLAALAAYIQQILDSDYLLKEFVRNTDVEWGRTMGERPFFEREGSPAHESDPYSIESVRKTLLGLLQKLGADSKADPQLRQ
jgi:hypothetical protein